MIKFAYKDYVHQYLNWARHHKTVSVWVKRVYDDGYVIFSDDKTAQEKVKKYVKLLVPHVVTYEKCRVTDYYLPLVNQDYQKLDNSVYSADAKGTMSIRLKFIIDCNTIYLDHKLKTEDRSASFLNMDLNNLLDEICENSKGMVEDGIEKSRVEGQDYHVIAVDDYGAPTDFNIGKQDLLQGLIDIEVYKFD
jgi:hypothetical protein